MIYDCLLPPGHASSISSWSCCRLLPPGEWRGHNSSPARRGGFLSPPDAVSSAAFPVGFSPPVSPLFFRTSSGGGACPLVQGMHPTSLVRQRHASILPTPPPPPSALWLTFTCSGSPRAVARLVRSRAPGAKRVRGACHRSRDACAAGI